MNAQAETPADRCYASQEYKDYTAAKKDYDRARGEAEVQYIIDHLQEKILVVANGSRGRWFTKAEQEATAECLLRREIDYDSLFDVRMGLQAPSNPCYGFSQLGILAGRTLPHFCAAY
jgi:hypothetical protein